MLSQHMVQMKSFAAMIANQGRREMKFLVLVEVRCIFKPLAATFVIANVRSHVTMLTPAMIAQTGRG